MASSPVVCIDNHILIWGLKRFASPGQEFRLDQTEQCLQILKEQKAQIVVPTVVCAEFLTGLDDENSRNQYIRIIQRNFAVIPFDIGASMRFPALWSSVKKERLEELKQQGATKQTLKADCMIVASAIQHKANMIISNDRELAAFASTYIEVKTIESMITVPEKTVPEQSSFSL